MNAVTSTPPEHLREVALAALRKSPPLQEKECAVVYRSPEGELKVNPKTYTTRRTASALANRRMKGTLGTAYIAVRYGEDWTVWADAGLMLWKGSLDSPLPLEGAP